MPRYIVLRPYHSDVATYAAGQVIEIDAELAAWFNRDMPGVLQVIAAATPPVIERHMVEIPAAAVETTMVTTQPMRKKRGRDRT